MSQFDFRRIHFQGTEYLDTLRSNNGKCTPQDFYDQNNAQSFLPPLVLLRPSQIQTVTQQFPSLKIIDQCNVEKEPINTGDLFNQWATMPLGSSPLDEDYWGLYHITPKNSFEMNFLSSGLTKKLKINFLSGLS